MENQMIFKRYEIKYMLTKEQKNMLLDVMKEHMIADVHGRSTILSLYLDTPDHLLIRRSIDKPAYKEKLRIRSYGVAGKDTEVFLELKKKYDSVVYKRREGMKERQFEEYMRTGTACKDTQIMREIDYSMKRYAGLAPAVMISCEREAFYAKNDHEFRMTFDENILWRDDDLSLCSPVHGAPLLKPGQALLEVKIAGSIPLWLVHFFSRNSIRPTSFSKYGSAYTTMLHNCSHDSNKDNSNNSSNKTNTIHNIPDGGTYKYA